MFNMYNPQSVNTQHTTHRKKKIDAKPNCNHWSPRLCVCRFNEFFWRELAKLQFPQWIAGNASAGALCSYFYGILYIQRTIVKNLTKTMEIIIGFFFIWKKCDIMIWALNEESHHCILEMMVKDGVCVSVGLDDITRRRRSSYVLKMFLSLTILR